MKIELSDDQALVLSDWLNRVLHLKDFSKLVDDRAVWSALFAISGSLETRLSVIFDASYSDKLEAARQRLVNELGNFE